MKKITVITGILVLATLLAVAQEENEYKTLNQKDEINTFFKRPHTYGYYGGISFGYTNINNKNTFIGGARGGWILDHRLILGFGGYGFVNNIDFSQNSSERGLAGGFGGLLIEPIVLPKSPIHVSFPVLIGAGGLTSVENSNDWENYEYCGAAYFIVVPGVELELNIVNFFRLAIGVNYRFTSDIVLTDIDGSQLVPTNVLRGFTGTLTFKFGSF